MHRLLQRQLKRHITAEELPPEWQAFIDAVEAAYQQADDDRALLERSLELTSQELLERNQQLRERREVLEQTVQARTAELEHRNIQLQTAAEVARDATQVESLDELFENTVVLVRERFGYYHTAIYMTDERNRFALLMAATGTAGEKMLANKFRQPLTDSNPIGIAIQSGAPFLNSASDDKTTGPAMPLLPDTQSELVLPLRAGETVIGALDVHSRASEAFSAEIRAVLQILADQLATAISNSRQLAETEKALRQLEVITGEYTQEVWQQTAQRSPGALGYRYRGVAVEPLETPKGTPPPEQASEQPGTTLTVPVRLRGQVIGQLDLDIEREEMLPETSALAESVAERMALALENARLLEATQQRVEQEGLVTEITTRVRETLDMETVLKTAVEEIRQRLALPEVEIRLGAPSAIKKPGEKPATPNQQETTA